MSIANYSPPAFSGASHYLPTDGRSDEAQELARKLSEARASLPAWSRMARIQALDDAIDLWSTELEGDADACSLWRVTRASRSYADRLLQLLPISAPSPDVWVDPDGEITLEWSKDPQFLFAVTVGPQGVLHYSGLFQGATAHGREYLVDLIPSDIWRHVARFGTQ